MTNLPSVTPEVMAKIDEIAHLATVQTICHIDTLKPANLLIKQVFADAGPMIPVLQKIIFEKAITLSMRMSLDVEAAFEFCKSVAHLAQ